MTKKIEIEVFNVDPVVWASVKALIENIQALVNRPEFGPAECAVAITDNDDKEEIDPEVKVALDKFRMTGNDKEAGNAKD